MLSSPVQFVKPVHVQTVVNNCAHFNTRSDQFPGDYYTLLMSLLCYEELFGYNDNEEMSMEIIADEETTKKMIETEESIKEIIETEELTK